MSCPRNLAIMVWLDPPQSGEVKNSREYKTYPWMNVQALLQPNSTFSPDVRTVKNSRWNPIRPQNQPDSLLKPNTIYHFEVRRVGRLSVNIQYSHDIQSSSMLKASKQPKHICQKCVVKSITVSDAAYSCLCLLSHIYHSQYTVNR
jgi:hypothetical protein